MFSDRRTSVDAIPPAMAPTNSMHRHTSSETGDMFSRRSSRAPSFSSDRPSVAGSVTFQMPTTVRPAPAYIAASVASQMVTDNHNAQLRQSDWDSEELENAIFSEQALALLNGFLDHLLFAFLSTARSPSLTAIRPAISEVLKPRLAREAAEAADEELQGLLSGDDDDESSPADGATAVDRWDVEKVWKRTRLRIMVYTRLGEMEDEDEEKYVQQERGLSMDEDEDEEAGLVSWASAIFLTSVVEYVAEQTLLVSGQAAYARMASRASKNQHYGQTEDASLERLVIEDSDVEKIALNSALGRLWRTWRKRVRASTQPLSPSRGIRPNSSYTSLHRRGSTQTAADESYRAEPTPVSEHAPTETDIAANIPLPITSRDVDEIEVPGLARTYEDAESSGRQTPVSRPQRPSSVIVLAPAESFRRRHNKERPSSMPGPEALPFAVPARALVDEDEDENQLETPFETPMTSILNRNSYMGSENTVEPLLLQHKGEGNAHDAMLASAMAIPLESGLAKSAVEPDTPTSTTSPTSDTYDVEQPKVLQSKRMSIGRSGPPGIVRTFSTRSSSLKSPRETPTATPMVATHAEATSYLDDHSDGEYVEGPRAIGVARTSDVPIQSSPTPSVEPWSERAKVVPANGGYVEVQPTPRSVPARNTPTPDSKPMLPDRSIARNDSLKRASPSIGNGAGPATAASTTSPARRRDSTPPTSGRTSLPSLQEVDYYKPQQIVPTEQTAHRNSPTFSNRSHTESPHLARDVAVNNAERQVPRRSTEESLRSQSAAGGSIIEKPGVKRVGSTSSKKSGSIHRLPSARDSDPQMSRSIGGRLSEDDRERQFEELVQGKETVKYTLTPENMRALDVSSDPWFPPTFVLTSLEIICSSKSAA